MHTDFGSKNFCLNFANKVLSEYGSKALGNMSAQRIAEELYGHYFIVYDISPLAAAIPIFGGSIANFLTKEAGDTNINYNDKNAWVYSLIWKYL